MDVARSLAAAACAVLLAGSCDAGRGTADLPPRTPHASPTTSDALVIGLVGTMTGPGSWRGHDAFEGADVAAHVLNRAAGRDRPAFELIVRDDRGDADRATRLVRELAGSDRTVGIVYAGPPSGLPPAEDALAAAGIPALLCYGDLYAAKLLQPHIFQMSPSLLWQARRIASYIARDRRYVTVGLIREKSLMGQTAGRSLQAALGQFGGRRAIERSYTHTGGGIDRLLRELRDRRVEALVVEGGPNVYPDVQAALERMGAAYRTTAQARIASAPPRSRRKRTRTRWWAPQLIGFDLAISPGRALGEGAVAAETYARGAHYLPVPSFERFRAAFVDWWDEEPLGWERRAFEAVKIIGWAVERARTQEDDLAAVLERLGGRRFGGLDVTFGPDDHTSVTETQVGLWVVPDRERELTERDRLPGSLPWVPLARGFSISGRRTIVLPQDWKHLFRGRHPVNGPAPSPGAMRFGVATRRRDPVH